MKNLSLNNQHHKRLEAAFRDWLELTGYASSAIYNMPYHLREFLHWIESREDYTLVTLTPDAIHRYFLHLRNRKNQRRSGALSINYLYKHLQSIRLFSRYLWETEQGHLDVDITLPGQQHKLQTVLTKQEINELYEACQSTPLGQRDRAMLAVYYGCGLRRSEGEQLDVSDYQQSQKLLYVRAGKNYRQRYVPLTAGVMADIENYLYEGRPALMKDVTETALFLNKYGNRLSGQSHFLRLKSLLEQAGLPDEAGLHTLRHSIATHLLESGMQLNYIARFLGHSSLESTQIYTHLACEMEN